jgi:hypothetical protein
MATIKTSPKQLITYFAASANDEELPMPIRRFAAQCTILSAHIDRLYGLRGVDVKAREALDANVAELANHVIAMNGGKPAAPVVPSQPGELPPAPVSSGDPTVDEAKEMAARVLAETAAEAEALESQQQKPGATVTPLPVRQPNGEQAAPDDAGGAA